MQCVQIIMQTIKKRHTLLLTLKHTEWKWVAAFQHVWVKFVSKEMLDSTCKYSTRMCWIDRVHFVYSYSGKDARLWGNRKKKHLSTQDNKIMNNVYYLCFHQYGNSSAYVVIGTIITWAKKSISGSQIRIFFVVALYNVSMRMPKRKKNTEPNAAIRSLMIE